jgi:hypothetical protein
MSITPEDLEHRVNAITLVLAETLGHLGRMNPEVLDHLGRLFVEREDNVTAIRPDSLAYARQLVDEARQIAAKHP